VESINQSINQSILFAKYDITAIVMTVVAGQQGSELHLQIKADWA